MKPKHSFTPRSCYLPQVHKPGIPMRPITSIIDSPAYATASHLTKLMAPLLGKTEFTETNSTYSLDQLKSISMAENDRLVLTSNHCLPKYPSRTLSMLYAKSSPMMPPCVNEHKCRLPRLQARPAKYWQTTPECVHLVLLQ